jgi:hypothetical protein
MTPRRITQVPAGCWVACIAGLTDIDHDDLAALVPALSEDPQEAEKQMRSAWSDYHNAVVKLMHNRGWSYAHMGNRIPRGYSVAVGESPRGVGHAVIALDGKCWWDPHPSREGISNITSFEVVLPILGQVGE